MTLADANLKLEELESRLLNLENIPAPVSGRLCNAALPHSDMTYLRGPNQYHCPCGQVYRKDGHGGLVEVE